MFRTIILRLRQYQPTSNLIRMVPTVIDAVASPPIREAVSVLTFEHPIEASAVDGEVGP